ncbi:MAG: four helix bundle protein [Butyricicoccus porcorum]
MSTNVSSSADFQLANMADDLLALTLDLCGRKDDKTPRFPRLLYDGYVSQIIAAAVAIQKNIIMANEMRRSEARIKLQQDAAAHCIWLVHMIRIAAENGWISEKQRDRWSKLAVNVKWKIVAWMKSDTKKR